MPGAVERGEGGQALGIQALGTGRIFSAGDAHKSVGRDSRTCGSW